MATFNIQYVLEGELDSEIVVLEGSNEVYDDIDTVFANPELSHKIKDWADSSNVGDQLEDVYFILTRVA